ncbi:MAG: hypothetical protein LC754_08550 [Acidobacteria bacterium]|nr:hypothetical protein [Acidobacteriota bacterium]
MSTVTTKGHVFHGTFAPDALVELLAARFDSSACAVVRRVDDARFVKFPAPEAAQFLSTWTEGQVFDEHSEVRWKKQSERYSVLLLTEDSASVGEEEAGVDKASASPGFTPLHDAPLEVRAPSTQDTHGFLLWGTRPVNGQWWEARIPRPLSYPLETSNKPPRLIHCLYSEGATVRWVRLKGLKKETR